MANLIMPDTFEPYYAGREDDAERRAKSRRQPKEQPKKLEQSAEDETVLPEEAPAPAGMTRRIRRPVAH